MDPAAITPPRRATTSDQAYEAILDAILQGKLLPNEPLRLKNLAESLEMSMMPVREAVRRLEALGVIEVEPYRGARVREVSMADLTDTYRTRILLEGYLARRAAVRFTPELHVQALAQLDLQAECLRNNDADAARAAHRGFHFTIYSAADAPWAVRSVEPTWANSERYRLAAGMSPKSVQMRRSEHEVLLDACAAGDAEAAEHALCEHLVHTVANLNSAAADQLAAEFDVQL